MNRKNKRGLLLGILLTAALAVLCGGCSLARSDLQLASESDHLCGVFVTFESEDAALNAVMYDQQGNFQKRYAEVTGDGDEKNYEFKGLNGYAFILAKENDTNRIAGNAPVTDTELNVNVNESDNESKDSIEGTLHYTKGFGDNALCLPVYKDRQGYYLSDEDRVSSDLSAESGLGSSASWTSAMDGKQVTKGFSYKVNFEGEDRIDSVRVKEFDKQDRPVKTTAIHFKKEEYRLKLQPETSYMIVEETATDSRGKTHTKHTAYDRKAKNEDEELTHFCYFADKPGIITPKELAFV